MTRSHDDLGSTLFQTKILIAPAMPQGTRESSVGFTSTSELVSIPRLGFYVCGVSGKGGFIFVDKARAQGKITRPQAVTAITACKYTNSASRNKVIRRKIICKILKY